MRTPLAAVLASLFAAATGCDDARPPSVDAGAPLADAGGPGATPPPSNRARFTFDCDLQGITGVLTMDVEAVGVSGAVWGSGPNPRITGVIPTGEVNYYTSGELRSPVAYYVFTGTNDFADFTEVATYERFRVQWVLIEDGVDMIINPFGSGPARHRCMVTSSRYL